MDDLRGVLASERFLMMYYARPPVGPTRYTYGVSYLV